jgi:putative ABC transport system permease protein
MKTSDLLKSSVSNTFRSKTRTTLTVLAIFIGAFTLTLTNALGAGVSDYVDKQVSSIGASDMLVLTKAATTNPGEGPVEYDEERSTAGAGAAGPLGGGSGALSEKNLSDAAEVQGVIEVVPIQSVAVDYITTDSAKKYEVSLSRTGSFTKADLAAGSQLNSEESTFQAVLPLDYIEALEFGDSEQAVGKTITVGFTTLQGDKRTLELEVVGVANTSLFTSGLAVNQSAYEEIHAIQREGIKGDETFQAAIAYIDPLASPEELTQIKSDLLEVDISGQTTEDQLGILQTVISGIVGVLNAFALIALLAAAFGIVNTLLMSVQERTREIGLMKAMGMGSGRIFGLFSLEATFIGFLGSVLGVLVAVGIGSVLSQVLTQTALADLPGLNILLFTPESAIGVMLLIMLIAFVSGSLPARRAARLNPIEALRYE